MVTYQLWIWYSKTKRIILSRVKVIVDMLGFNKGYQLCMMSSHLSQGQREVLANFTFLSPYSPARVISPWPTIVENSDVVTSLQESANETDRFFK